MSDYRQRKYAHRFLILLHSYHTKHILLITLRVGDGNAQPEEQPEGDGIWYTNQKVRNYRQHLARQVSIRFCMDPAERVEPVINLKSEELLGRIIV